MNEAVVEQFAQVGAVVVVESIEGRHSGRIVAREGGWLSVEFAATGSRSLLECLLSQVVEVESAAPGFESRFARAMRAGR